MDCQYKFCVVIVHLFLESEETDYYIYGNIMVTTSTVVQLIAKKGCLPYDRLLAFTVSSL